VRLIDRLPVASPAFNPAAIKAEDPGNWAQPDDRRTWRDSQLPEAAQEESFGGTILGPDSLRPFHTLESSFSALRDDAFNGVFIIICSNSYGSY
jgi:hypothetical protein